MVDLVKQFLEQPPHRLLITDILIQKEENDWWIYDLEQRPLFVSSCLEAAAEKFIELETADNIVDYLGNLPVEIKIPRHIFPEPN